MNKPGSYRLVMRCFHRVQINLTIVINEHARELPPCHEVLPQGTNKTNYCHKPTRKGVNQRSKYVIQRQRPESPTVTLTWHACKYKVHKLHQGNILSALGLLLFHNYYDKWEAKLNEDIKWCITLRKSSQSKK